MPKVSVIIPCYNHGRFIDDAVDSILAQTFQDFEIIIVNDGSTDEYTVNKLKNYNKSKTVVHHTENRKLPAARNFGIRNSSGEFILTLDADDKFYPTFIEKAVAILNTKPHVGIVSSYLEAFGIFSLINSNFKSGGVENFLRENNSHASAMFRRKCFDETGGYNETFTNNLEDWEFWLNITKRGWLIEILQEPLSLYRQIEGSLSSGLQEIRPELVKKMVTIHRELFEKYVVEAIYEREKHKRICDANSRWLFEENKILRKMITDIKESWSYRIGNIIVRFVNSIKTVFKKNAS